MIEYIWAFKKAMKANFISRPIYINRIKPFIDKHIIKVLVGQRRIGKSYLMLELIAHIKASNPDANIISIDLEQEQYSILKNSTSLYEYIQSKLNTGKSNYVFIDEIQEVAEFERCIRSLHNEQVCDIFITGSNAKMLSGELATLLSGRYIEFPIHGLSYDEFLVFRQLPDNNESLNQYLIFGGMPFLRHIGLVQELAFEYLKNVYSTILLKDVVAREGIRNVALLENLVSFLVNNTGSLVSAQNISKFLKNQNIKIPTQSILNYLRALTSSFFIQKVQRTEVSGLKIFEIGEKYYFEDLGLRNCVNSFQFVKDVGKLMENAVFQHLSRCKYRVFIGKMGEKEIDFVGDKIGKRVYIQVTYLLKDETTIDREFGNLLAIQDNFPKYVVTLDTFQISGNYKGIIQIHLREFLKMSEF